MANLKFSQFQEQTDPANVQFVVGYNGTDNVRIDPANLGGGGATDLNGLTDVLIDGDSAYFINIPTGLTGNPDGNIIIGSGAANSMTTATENVVIGVNALANDSGSSNANRNVVIGYSASQASTNQVQGVVAIGWEASKANGNAFGGTHIGYRAADSSSSKYRSTSVGYNAHGGSANATDCVAVGYGASAFSTGAINGSTTVGFEAGSRSDAQQTTLIGYQASKDNQVAGVVSLGYKAGFSQTNGTENTYLGWSAGYSVSTGSHNTVIGYEAGYGSLSGDSNTLIGASAGYSGSPNLLTGSNNIIIGHDASPSAFDANNEITLGNSSIASLRCQVQTISSLSDSRDKTNIKPSTYGLDFVNKLNPVTFDWNTRDGAKVGDKDLGFIAQELQVVDDENLQLVYDKNPDKLEASYGRLIPVLVKAIQELKAEIELLK